jgi:eukaryotic translation initiation factor 2C
VSAIRQAFDKVKKARNWKSDIQTTAIVVTKRQHTLSYPNHETDMEGEGKNCKPGTVVDTMVATPYFKDFFFQLHSGLKGATKPAHYLVIVDDMKWDVGILASFVSRANL